MQCTPHRDLRPPEPTNAGNAPDALQNADAAGRSTDGQEGIAAHEPRPTPSFPAGLHADATAIGAAIFGVTVVVRIVYANEAFCAGESGDPPAEGRLGHTDAAAISAAVLGVTLVVRIVDTDQPFATSNARDASAELAGAGLALAAPCDARARGGRFAAITVRHAITPTDGLILFGADVGALGTAAELTFARAVSWRRLAVLIRLAFPRQRPTAQAKTAQRLFGGRNRLIGRTCPAACRNAAAEHDTPRHPSDVLPRIHLASSTLIVRRALNAVRGAVRQTRRAMQQPRRGAADRQRGPPDPAARCTSTHSSLSKAAAEQPRNGREGSFVDARTCHSGAMTKLRWGKRWFSSVPLLASCAASAPSLPPPRPSVAATAEPDDSSIDKKPSRGSKPSKGCGKPAGPVGERQLTVGHQTGLYIVSLPQAYDPAKAYPLGFAFHGRTRSHKDCRDNDCGGFQSVMSEDAVLVYMQSLREPGDTASGWDRPEERASNLQFFELVRAAIEADYCVDERRVFLAGSSSGGNFANLLGCLHGDRFLAVAPVSGSLKDPPPCVGAPAALVIHGIDDSHITLDRGEQARENYRKRSGCGAATTPELSEMHAQVRRARDQKPSVETLACVDYTGCREGSPLRWCEHSYGGWDNSTHGWPPVGGQVIWDFVEALPVR